MLLHEFSKSKGHNSANNQRTKAKLELDLELVIVKQSMKYQLYVCKHDQKKCGKLTCQSDELTDWQMDGVQTQSLLLQKSSAED